VKKPDWNCNELWNQSFAVQFAVHNQFRLGPTQAGLELSKTNSIIFYIFSAIGTTHRWPRSVKKWLRYHHISVECWQNHHLRLYWPYLIHFLTILNDLWCILELESRAINVFNVHGLKPVRTGFSQFLKFCQKIWTRIATDSNLWWTGTAVQFFCSLLQLRSSPVLVSKTGPEITTFMSYLSHFHYWEASSP